MATAVPVEMQSVDVAHREPTEQALTRCRAELAACACPEPCERDHDRD